MTTKNYRQSLWSPKPGDYEISEEGWKLFSEQCKEDIRELRHSYPELSHWGDIERINAWGNYCSDANFTAWTEPYRTENFLLYLELAQEGKLPDCSQNKEAIWELIEIEGPEA